METKTLLFELRDFTGHRCLNGVARKGERKINLKHANSFRNFLQIFPNGNKPENVDYVSIVFDTIGVDILDLATSSGRYRNLSNPVLCVISIVDANGDLRFSQSFEIREKGRCLPMVEMDRFVSRRVLLDASEELLPNDTLTLRFDASNSFSINHHEYQSDIKLVENMYAVAKKESWFIENKIWSLDLSNANSPLCTKLRKKSEFFRGLFQSACKEMEKGYMPVDRLEFHHFRDMLFYIRFGSTLHLRSVVQFQGVYQQACFYGVRDLEEICIEHFKQNLPSERAIQILRIADSRGDAELRTLAFKKALAEWGYVGSSQDWRDLRLEWPQLANELLCAARILNLEKVYQLFNLVTGHVLQNKNILQHTPTWLIFVKKLPDLTKVILEFDSYKFKQVEKNHISDYNFYQN